MDGLSIASAAIAFLDAAAKIKASLDKVGHNRQRIRILSNDIMKDLDTLKRFCCTHAIHLENVRELRDSLDELKSQLSRVSSRCEGLLIAQTKGILRKLVAMYREWRDADEIEAEVLRLKEKVQACLNLVHFYVSARTEMAMARVENSVVVLRSDMRSHMRRFDSAFGTTISRSGSREFTSLLQYSEPDQIDRQYLYLKLQYIVESLEARTPAVADPGFLVTSTTPYITFRRPTTKMMSIIGSTLEPAWRIISLLNDQPATTFTLRELMPIIHLAINLEHSDFNDVLYRIYDVAAHIVRRLIQIYDDDSLLVHLCWVLLQQYDVCPNGPKLAKVSREWVDIQRKLYQSPRDIYPKSLRRIWVRNALPSLAWARHLNGDFEGAVSCYEDSLQLTDPATEEDIEGFVSITCDLSGGGVLASPTFTHNYSVAQSTARTLSFYARSLESLGRYSEAHHAGRDSIAIIHALRARVDDLPQNFNFFDRQLLELQRDLPSWMDITRNPTNQRSGFIEEVDREDERINEGSGSSSQYIEWGIAI